MVFLTSFSSPDSLAFIKLSKRAEGNLASIGRTRPSGSFMINSTRLPLPGMTSALLSNWLAWKISLMIDSRDHSPNFPAKVPPDK